MNDAREVYVVDIESWGAEGSTRWWVETPFGELKAAGIAAITHRERVPEQRFSSIAVSRAGYSVLPEGAELIADPWAS